MSGRPSGAPPRKNRNRMEESQSYQNYVIRADPIQVYAPIRWSIAVVIERHDGDDVKTERHEAQETRPTENEAILSSLVFGRQIVNGQHPDLPLP